METHELCVICGLTPDGGPTRLFDTKEKCLDNLIKNLQDMNLDLDMGEQELRQEIENILDLFEWAGDGYRELLQETSLDAPYFPFPDQLWDGWKAIVIGTFDESGQHLSTTFYDANGFLNYRPSRGYDVITQLVDQHSVLGGYFDMVDMDNYISASSYMSNGNLFCLRAPYFYLQAWLHRETLPPRQIAFPSEPDMSFEGELYEIINTRKEARRGGILCAINYGGIEHTYDGQYQDYLECDDTRPTRLGQLLKMGKRGHDLIPGFLYDFNTWQTCPTDRWLVTKLPFSASTKIQVSEAPHNATTWDKVPEELIFEIFINLPLKDIISFVSSCRYLHRRFGNPTFLASAVRILLRSPQSSIYWFMPVATVNGELEKFCEVCNQSWSSENNEPAAQSPDGASIILAPNFPLFQFLQANYCTDSMRNRRRIWNIVQQFRQEWYKYRTEGYEYDVFKRGFIRPP